jgi:hypothetical protein
MKINISNSGVFQRIVDIEPVDSLPAQFCLRFQSVLTSAKDSLAQQRNFEAILGRDDVMALRDLIDAALKV